MTSDNGTEFACHGLVAKQLKTDFYFANPHHPWKRGSNENSNGLIRQYFPKGIELKNKYSQLRQAVNRINNRPHKCLGYATAAEAYESEILS